MILFGYVLHKITFVKGFQEMLGTAFLQIFIIRLFSALMVSKRGTMFYCENTALWRQQCTTDHHLWKPSTNVMQTLARREVIFYHSKLNRCLNLALSNCLLNILTIILFYNLIASFYLFLGPKMQNTWFMYTFIHGDNYVMWCHSCSSK